MNASELLHRFRDLQAYVGWTAADGVRVQLVAKLIAQRIRGLIDDFYAEIERHPDAARIITGGDEQIRRLKASLRTWLLESLECHSDAEYLARRWSIGLRHAEIGLNPAYTSVAVARLRNGIIDILTEAEVDPPESFRLLVQSFNKLLDVELAIIQDAYQAEYLKREKQAEHERSEVKFRMLVEAAACMVVILRENRSVAYFSPYSEELTGHAASDVIGRDFVERFIPESARADIAAQIEATFAGCPTVAYEAPVLRRDGSQRWLVWNAQRLDDFDGSRAVLAVGQDFTDRREAQEQLLRSERLAGIGQMITGLAHESRNALQRIQSCSEMLELEVADNAEAMRLVRRLHEAQDNLLRLFDEVRNYAAPIQLERTACRLESTWREAWSVLETARRERDASLSEQTDGADLTLLVDRFRMVQLFRNMFENTLAACPDPTRIAIHCREVQFQQEPALEIRVRDNGPGLSRPASESVFEPFFTTKTKGTGLGMAIARRIVDAHGGQIIVGSDWRDGAEFIITLPRNIA